MKHSKREKGRFPIFKERFKELQGERSDNEFGDFLMLSRQTVGFYRNGDRIPDALLLAHIAKKCGVSADWLIGLTNTKKTINNEESADSLGLPESYIERLRMIREGGLFGEWLTIPLLFDNGNFLTAIESIASAVHSSLGEGKRKAKKKAKDEKDLEETGEAYIPQEDPEFIKAENRIKELTHDDYAAFPKEVAVSVLLNKARDEFYTAAKTVVSFAENLDFDEEFERLIKNRPGATNTGTANDQD